MQPNNLLEKVRNKYKYMGIKNRILLMVSGIIIGCTLITSYIFIVVFKSNITNEHIRYTQKLLTYVNTQMNNYFDELGAIANEPNYNYYLQNYLIDEKEQENPQNDQHQITKEKMENFQISLKAFSSAFNSRSDILTLMICGEEQILLKKSIYYAPYLVNDYSQYDWYRKAVNTPENLWVWGSSNHDFLVGRKEPSISFSKAIRSCENGEILGVILIEVNLNRISEICDAVYASNGGDVLILDEKGEIVYSRGQSYEKIDEVKESLLLANIHSTVQEIEKDNFTIQRNGLEYIGVYQPIVGTNWKFIHMKPMMELVGRMYQITFLIIGVISILLVLIIIVLNKLLIEIVHPIIYLKHHMDLADAGNLDIKVEVLRNDETGMLARSFNKMIERVRNLMDEVIKEQEDKRKYELQVLQAQINPHFLYNTLDSIIWMAEANNRNIVPMTEALARLFRISLNKGNEFICLKDEIEHVRSYLIIQSMRYMDKLDYSIEVAEEIKNCKTIKLILQPIVENCIYHGIKKKRGKGHIVIRASKNGEYLEIEIMDDGIGMDQEMCRNILLKTLEGEKDSRGSGVGIKNVNERIRLYFGEVYGIRYISTLGEGTTAILTLPIIEEGRK